MSKFHITPTLCLYNAIQFPYYNSIPTPESAGLSLYHDKYEPGTVDVVGGALYISVRTGGATNSGFEYRPMINKIVQGTGILVTKDTNDPGKVTISLSGGEGGSDSSVIFKHVECTTVNSNGCCYAQIDGINDSGFVYRAYRIPTGTSKQENINVNCYPYTATGGSGITDTTYLAIDFDSSVTFNNLKSGTKDSMVHVEILKGSVGMGEAITPITEPHK